MKNKAFLIITGIALLGIIGFFILNAFVSKNTQNFTDAPYMENEDMENKERVVQKEDKNYVEFNEKDFAQAQSDGKYILLNFYASWCPICRAEEPRIKEGFKILNNPNVSAFRVNYNDPETDEVEKALAKQYKVTYQHTKVLLDPQQKILLNKIEAWEATDVTTNLGDL